MNRSRVAGVIRAWVDLYTRGLPAEVRATRRDEIDDDLWCEVEEAAAGGRSPRQVDAEMLVRWLLGMPADVGWSLAQRSRSAAASPEPRLSMTDRTLGTWATLGGLVYLALGALYAVVGDALWANGIGAYVVLASLVGGTAFAVAGVGLAWHHQDDLGRVGAAGGGVVGLGALVTMAGPPLLLALGSAVLMGELGRARVISRSQAAAHVMTALAVLGAFGLLHLGSTDPGSRALSMAVFLSYTLSWVAIGLSLVRRHRTQEAAGIA